MPWYWILIIISAIVGPFEAMHALNKARKNREEAEKRRKAADGKQTDAPAEGKRNKTDQGSQG
jgi:hypothetical protein